MKTTEIDGLARSLAGPFAFCGIAVAGGGQRHFAVAQQPFLHADEGTMFRVASVSKVVVGQTLARLLTARGIGWGTDVSDLLGWELRNPAFPDVPVTMAALACHCSGLDDARGYQLPPQKVLQDFFAENRFSQNQAGTYFCYSNLGYVILAEIIERLSGTDFIAATARLIPDHGGFNWAGVDDARMAHAIPTYRRDGAQFVAQIDDPPQRPSGKGTVARYSPQGGLRLSLRGMLDMAERLALADRTVLWRKTDGPGDYLGGAFSDYGAGLQIFDQPTFYPRPLIGHFGNAYGFNGGVWYDAERDLAFAYALNGLDMGDEDDRFSAHELAIFDVIAKVADA